MTMDLGPWTHARESPPMPALCVYNFLVVILVSRVGVGSGVWASAPCPGEGGILGTCNGTYNGHNGRNTA
jgi:hypothetical protein